jgi:hypothetical protein
MRLTRSSTGWVTGSLSAALLLLFTACATTSSFDGTLFHGPYVSFRVPPVPATWHRISVPAADLAFRDDAHEGSVLLNSRCASADRDAPLVSLTGHLIIGTTERKVAMEETVPFDQREARHTRMTAKLDGVPMAYDIFVLKKDGCVFDLVYVTPPDTAAVADPEFERFVQGFHTVPAS